MAACPQQLESYKNAEEHRDAYERCWVWFKGGSEEGTDVGLGGQLSESRGC